MANVHAQSGMRFPKALLMRDQRIFFLTDFM